MERIVGLLLIFVVGVHGLCKVIKGPDDVAVTMGGKAKMSCKVQNPNQVTWLRTDSKNNNQPVYVWYDEESMDRDIFTVATRTSGSTTTYELIINANKDTAGTYSCGCAGKDTKSAVLTVMEESSCYKVESWTPTEGEVIGLKCEATFTSRPIDLEVYFLDSKGQEMTGDHSTEFEDNGIIIQSVLSSLQVTWEDNERDYVCYSDTDNIKTQECSLKLEVLHWANNFSLIPDKNTYYHGEQLTVFFEANPPAHKIKWTYLNTGTVVEENADSITINSTWSGYTNLEVAVSNVFASQEYTIPHTFQFTVGGGSGACDTHYVAFLLFISLLLISLNLMSE